MAEQDNVCETPWEDLRARALREYEAASTVAHSWSSVIPQAINYYFDHARADLATTTATVDDEQRAQKIASFSSTAFELNELAVREQLAANITYALTQSRAEFIKLVEAKRDEWQAKEDSGKILFGHYVQAANQILTALRLYPNKGRDEK
jgi:hypothetical protein